jgi:glutathione S-transferase
MKLFDGGKAPNPRRVRVFLAEKGLTVPDDPLHPDRFEPQPDDVEAADGAEQGPVLVLDDDTVIAESLAICRYFEGIRPEPPLFGRPGKEAALVEMWNRRIELTLGPAVAAAFATLQSGAAQPWDAIAHPEDADEAVLAFLRSLDEELADRLFVVNDHYTVADITALVSIDFVMPAAPAMPDELVNLRRWYAQVTARPSASA